LNCERISFRRLTSSSVGFSSVTTFSSDVEDEEEDLGVIVVKKARASPQPQ
jgi:hypothetical protein